MKKNILITLADKNYVNQAKQLFSSVYFNAGWKGDYMLLAHEIPEKELKWFREKGILIKKCKGLFSKKEWYSNLPKKVLPPVVSSKFYLFTPYFKKWGSIIYLDSDIIVRASLEDLTKLKGFNAVEDLFLTIKKQLLTDNKSYKRLKKEYNLNLQSFNAGVFAFSADIIRENTFNELKKLFLEYRSMCLYSEQTILNLYFYKKWKNLPISFNFNPIFIMNPWRNKKPINLGIIWHFFLTKKPWINRNSCLYNKWNNNLEKSDSINLQQPIDNPEKYTEEEILKQSSRIKRRILFCSFLLRLDYLFGLTGIFLKRYSPKFYYFLKKQILPK